MRVTSSRSPVIFVLLGFCFFFHPDICAESWELRPMGDDAPGSKQIRDGKIDEAIQLLHQARKDSDTEDSTILGNLCVAHALKLRYPEALSYCSRAINRANEDPLVYNNRGAVRAAMGDKRGASRDFQRAACIASCLNNCDKLEDSSRSVALRNLRRLKKTYPELDHQPLRFQAQL